MPQKLPNHTLHGPKKINVKKMGDITWRIFRIMSEFVDGFEFLSQFRKEVTIFGSARLAPETHWYKEAEKLGAALTKEGYTVITGGGPGIMEAANKGAHKHHPERSVGINIELPHEQRVNQYVERSAGFHYFFTRKVMLSASAQVYIFFPGGFGTLDEFTEMLELVQTGKTVHVPIILMGKDFWQPMVDWIKNTMVKKYKTVSPDDVKLFTIVETTEQAMKIVRKSVERTIF